MEEKRRWTQCSHGLGSVFVDGFGTSRCFAAALSAYSSPIVVPYLVTMKLSSCSMTSEEAAMREAGSEMTLTLFVGQYFVVKTATMSYNK